MHRAPCASAVVILVVLCSIGGRAADPSYPAVRPLQPGAAKLVQAATACCNTVRSLVEYLNRSDVVAYIEYNDRIEINTARTIFLTKAGGYRYLLVSINPRNPELDRMALLGHELAHAVEIADAPEIDNQASLARYYAREGKATNRTSTRYETAAALQAAGAVLREHAASRRNE